MNRAFPLMHTMNAGQNAAISVPADWSQQKDREYFLAEGPPNMTPDQLPDDIQYRLFCCEGALYRALEFLTNDTDARFGHASMEAKVKKVRDLFHQRSTDQDYLARMDGNLQEFVYVERLYLPILERYSLAPESVWLRQLVDARNCIYDAYLVFEESMKCEHDPCPQFGNPGDWD